MAELRDRIVLVNLSKEYSRELLVEFFQKLLKPNFGAFEDELDSLDVWIDAMENGTDDAYVLHVLLAFDKADKQRKNLLGGVSCEYYPNSSVGLLTYFAVAADQRKKGLGQFLVDAAHKTMQRQSMSSGGGMLRCFFLETNSAEKVAKERDVMDPAVRTKIIRALGLEPLAIDYTQPALQADKAKCNDLLLCVHKRYLTPEGAPSGPVAEFIQEFFYTLMGKKKSRKDADNLRIQSLLGALPYIPILANATVAQVKQMAEAAKNKSVEEQATRKRAEEEARAKAAAEAKAAAARKTEDNKAKAKVAAEAKAKADAEAEADAKTAAAAAPATAPATAPAPVELTRELAVKLAPESVSVDQKVNFLRGGKQTVWKRFDISETDAAEAYYRFNRADKDGSGSLTSDEILEVLRVVMAGQMKDSLLGRLANTYFNVADKDKSGSVNVDEFYQIYSEIKKAVKAPVK